MFLDRQPLRCRLGHRARIPHISYSIHTMAPSLARFGCSAQIARIRRPTETVNLHGIVRICTSTVTMVPSKLWWCVRLGNSKSVSLHVVWQHLHPRMVEPRPFLNIEVKGHNGSITTTIPRSFRGQLTLHTDNGRVYLSPALAPHASSLSTVNGTHTYFVGQRPSNGKWHTGGSEDGDEVDGLIASSKNGSIRVSYDDEDVSTIRGPGVLSSLFKAM